MTTHLAQPGDLVIRNGRVVAPAQGIDAVLDVLIRNGRIARVAPDIDSAAPELYASGLVVSAGFVDLHAHLREPGFEQKGTIATETEAALRGGFTTVCAMPNTEPAPDSAPVVEALLERIRQSAKVRVFPIGTVTRGRNGEGLSEIAEIVAAGCVAISDDGSPVADSRLMRHALELARAARIPLSEHSDDPSLGAGGVMHEGRISERLGLSGQPAAAEVCAIARNLALCEATGARLHIAHISTARGVELVAEAKARALPVTCEVTPSHLFLTEDAVTGAGPDPAYDTNARINPPLRTESDRKALVAAVNSGVIDAIATDHAPHAIEDKLCEFDYAAPGISCFETAAGTLLTQVARSELRLEAVIAALTSRPADVFALGERVAGLGTLTEGAPGDVTLLSADASWVVDARRFASKGRNTPLDGETLTGRVHAVVRAGAVAWSVEAAHA